MKIVHLLGWYFPDSVGGTEIYVQTLCRHLRAAGHDVLVAAPIGGDNARAGAYSHDGVTVFRFPVPAATTRDEALGRVPARGSADLHAWLAAERPDLIHVHSFTTGIGLQEIRRARQQGTRVIVTCHLPGLGYMCRAGELMRWGTEPCDGIVEPSKCAECNLTRLGLTSSIARIVGTVPPGLSDRLGRLPGRIGTTLGMAGSIAEHTAMQRELFELVERFVVLNETAKRMLIANGSTPAKIAINRLGISRPDARPKPGPSQRRTAPPVHLGYVGRIHRTKGLVELVSAVRRIPSDVAFTLDIRGPLLDSSARAFVRELEEIAAGDRRIRFEPAVDPADVPRVLAELDALLCPSIWFENGPTVALEANAVGTPVIGSRVGNLAEIVDDGVSGRLVAAGDLHGWSRAIAEVATDPAGTIDRWRANLPATRTMDDVARDYLSMYSAA
jgi:glycosyltransferase involved in cell wall biosynthesis